jgi:RimJ/RimL family protein N-acetyltransferase
MTLHIEPVDATDRTAFAPFHEVYAAASLHGPQGEFATVWQLEEIRLAMADSDPRTSRLGWLGRAEGRPVAFGWMEVSTVDNLDVADVLIGTAPGDRGQGYAGAMLTRVEDEARALGRDRLVAEVRWPYDAGPAGTGSTDLAWAQAHGFELGLVEVQRRLALPVPDATLEALASVAAPYHDGYELRSFLGTVPDDLVEGWATLSALIDTEAPMGDIEREATTADVEAVRAMEALVEAQGRAKVNTVARAPDGEVVGYTDIAVTVHESERAYQWGTLVRGDHRGHRLGLAMKVANLRLLQEAHPQITTMVTFNADVNAPMVAVNDRLGFVPVQWLGQVQKTL